MRIGLQIQGLAQLQRTLEALPPRVSKAVLREALGAVAEPLRASIARHAPRGDPQAPNLADSIAIATGRAGRSSSTVVVGPTKDVTYARFLEFGTRYLTPRAFMRRAWDAESPQLLAPLGGALWRALVGRGISTRASGGGGGLT